MSLVTKLFTGVLAWAQVVVFPLLLIGPANLNWRLQLVAATLLPLCLALAQARIWPAPLLGLAALLGLITCSAQWTLLPLVLAQRVLAWLLSTQSLTPPLAASVWLIECFFLQVTLTTVASQVIDLTALIDLALVMLPFLISIWAKSLPGWLDVIAIILVAGVGMYLQHLTLLSALAIVLLAVVVSTRSHPLRPLWVNAAALATGLIIIATRLHG